MDSQGIGRSIDGRFELVGRLGSGGMGAVWRARDLALHREVALKEVRPADPDLMESDPGAGRMLRERVLREARALARLTHPHVVTIHHIVDSPDHPYPWIVMELVPGQSLHERLTRGPLPIPEAIRIGRGLLSALRAAHAVGIHHRDIKPANVLLRPDGSPVLTDFGIAVLREATSLTATGDLIGSPEYIAPERIRGQEGNPASDLWSLGMLLYVAVEGSHPLRRETSLATLVAVMDERIPPPVRSGSLTPVLHALLVRDPAARPTAERLESMLEAAERESHGAAPQVSPTPPMNSTPMNSTPASGMSGPWPPGPSTPHPAFGPPPTHPYLQPPYPQPPHPQPSRRRPVGRLLVALAATAAVIGTTVTALTLLPPDKPSNTPRKDARSADSPQKENGVPSAESFSGSRTESSESSDSSQRSVPQPANLLTPSGVRTAIKALRPVMGGTKVLEFTVYPEYVLVETPKRDDPKLYDRYEYRDGVAKRSDFGGGTVDADDVTVDVTKVSWDSLPTLLRKADKDLGVDKPTSRYVIVSPDLITNEPAVRVYVADSYGGAYLSATFEGTVQKRYPR